MTDKQTQALADQGNMEKDPADWVTGDEPMTGAQRSYLKTLSEEAHEPFDGELSKAQASQRIDELKARTGRGTADDHPKVSQHPSPEGDRPRGQTSSSERPRSIIEETTERSGYTGT